MNYYNEIAEGYDELHEEEQLDKLETIKDMLEKEDIEISSECKLLDVGCGTGISTRFWDYSKCERIGIDPAEKLIAIAQKKDIYGQYFVEAAENISFEDELFDFVISVSAIHNFENVGKALEEIKRVSNHIVVITVLKKAAAYEEITKKIKNKFELVKEREQEMDSILLCFKDSKV
jgi:ubiquinone/menaquinone biosynthesis C-methylase UbiE